MGRKHKNARKRRRAKPLRIETLLEQHKHKLQSIEKIEQEIAAMQKRKPKDEGLRFRTAAHDPLDGTMPIVFLAIGCALLVIIIVLISLFH